MTGPFSRTRGSAVRVLLLCTSVLVPNALAAQQQPAQTPAARPADVASIDAIITALYDVISGPTGQARDWNRMRSLFIPGARLIPTGQRQDGTGAHSVLTAEDYITRSGAALTEMGFREVEINRVTEQFGNIAHSFSTYHSFRGTETAPFMRGINSIQLWNDGARWWIVSVFWQQESPQHPIPAKYIR